MAERLVSRTDRLAQMERLLFAHPKGLRAVEIAKAMGVNRRTVYRDLDALGRGGVPIWQDAGRFGLHRDRYLATVRLNVHEAVILFLAAGVAAARTDAFGPALGESLAQLAKAFPEPVTTWMAQSAEALGNRAPPGGGSGAVETLKVIAEGWIGLRQVRLWVGERQYDVSICCLTPTRMGDLALIGLDEATGSVGAIPLAQVLDRACALPADFEPRQYLAQAQSLAGDEPLADAGRALNQLVI